MCQRLPAIASQPEWEDAYNVRAKNAELGFILSSGIVFIRLILSALLTTNKSRVCLCVHYVCVVSVCGYERARVHSSMCESLSS